MDDRRARQLIETAEASEKLHQLVAILPTRESHVRELLKLDDDGHRAEVITVITSGARILHVEFVYNCVHAAV